MIKYSHPEYSNRDIKNRLNNGFCSSAPNRDKCWKCICENFKNTPCPAWCSEDYKEEIEENDE